MARHLQPADRLLTPAVNATLKHLDLAAADDAAVVLARKYAAAIDAGTDETLNDLGPKLLAVLESLGATPRARAALQKGGAGGQGQGQGKLAAIRAARRPA
ncbi:MAG TPA: hypothetical protein VF202_01015 [Trueperaceae bacterium]